MKIKMKTKELTTSRAISEREPSFSPINFNWDLAAPFTKEFKFAIASCIAGYKIHTIWGNNSDFIYSLLSDLLAHITNQDNLPYPASGSIPFIFKAEIDQPEDLLRDNLIPKLNQIPQINAVKLWKKYNSKIDNIRLSDDILKKIFNWGQAIQAQVEDFEMIRLHSMIQIIKAHTLISKKQEVDFDNIECIIYSIYPTHIEINTNEIFSRYDLARTTLETLAIDLDAILNPIRNKFENIKIEVNGVKAAWQNNLPLNSYVAHIDARESYANIMANYVAELGELESELNANLELVKHNATLGKRIIELSEDITHFRQQLVENK